MPVRFVAANHNASANSVLRVWPTRSRGTFARAHDGACDLRRHREALLHLRHQVDRTEADTRVGSTAIARATNAAVFALLLLSIRFARREAARASRRTWDSRPHDRARHPSAWGTCRSPCQSNQASPAPAMFAVEADVATCSETKCARAGRLGELLPGRCARGDVDVVGRGAVDHQSRRDAVRTVAQTGSHVERAVITAAGATDLEREIDRAKRT